MKPVCAFVLIAVSQVQAVVWPSDVDLARSSYGLYCFSRTHNRRFAVGEEWGSSYMYGCRWYKCGHSGYYNLPCGAFRAFPGSKCVIELGDVNDVYPGCCAWPRCTAVETVSWDTTVMAGPKRIDLLPKRDFREDII